MKPFVYLVICLIIFSSCTTWKGLLVSNGSDVDALQNAIHDFLNSSTLSKNDSVFDVSVKHINEDILGISIYGYTNKLLIVKDGNSFNYSGLPTRYIEQEGKLFYWDDPTRTVTLDLINVLKRYNIIDTMILDVYIPEMIIGQAKKGEDYYFCKKNLLEYKRIRTKTAMGYYDPPKLNCNQ